MKVDQTGQFVFPSLGPGNLLNSCISELPETIAFFPNSNWMDTLIRQLTRITQNVTNPPVAPKLLVAISSPDPTMEAERINPGPKKPRVLRIPAMVWIELIEVIGRINTKNSNFVYSLVRQLSNLFRIWRGDP